MIDEPIYARADAEYTQGEIKNDRKSQQKEGTRNGRDYK